MATTTRERVIGLWLDGESGEDRPSWIVSRDTWEYGEPANTTTARVFDEDCYDLAKEAAIEIAEDEGLRVIRTSRYGVRTCVYDPAD